MELVQEIEEKYISLVILEDKHGKWKVTYPTSECQQNSVWECLRDDLQLKAIPTYEVSGKCHSGGVI